MPLTIERIRTLVLIAAGLLLAALGVFLVRAKWTNLLNHRDLPKRLARDIQQEANGFTFVHALGAHSQFKIHASREVQLRDNRVQLHDVRIELYGDDGSRVDEIAGQTFDYDQKSGLAIAEGPVEMVLTRPPARSVGAKGNEGVDNAPAQIHLKTSGVTFDQDTGMVATAQRVDFTMKQGEGSAVGAMYDSQNGYLTLDHSVELKAQRGREPVAIEAQRAEFDRGAQSCVLHTAKVNYRGGEAAAAQARILFRTDGTAAQLNATDGFTMQTATGGHLGAPTAQIEFDEHNQPRHGHLEGSVTMDSVTDSRAMHGTSPTAELEFAARGMLRHARLERGVVFQSEETTQPGLGQNDVLHVIRTWRSPVADLSFNDAGNESSQLEGIRGTGGVTFESESRRGSAAAVSAKMTADEIMGTFGEGSSLRTLTGVGHAAIEQTTAAGTRQSATGDRMEAQFAGSREQEIKGSRDQRKQGTREQASKSPGNRTAAAENADVQRVELDGHVVLFDQAAAKPGSQQKPPIHATSGKAVYEGAGQWIHMTIGPRVEYGDMQLASDKLDISQQSGEAFARGNVKGTWNNTAAGSVGGRDGGASGAAGPNMTIFGGRTPAHVVASEAHLNQSTGETTFSGRARLWQLANSVSGPVIVLNQHLQTLMARSSNPSDPVRAVLLAPGGSAPGLGARLSSSADTAGRPESRNSESSVIRVSGGELEYFDAEHRAVMRGGALGAVTAETGTARSSSDAVDFRLMPTASSEGSGGGQIQVDRMTATGHVTLTSQGRTGSGEQLVYSSVTGEYVLTGTAGAPPKLTDPGRGTVTGEALIFHSRDDSVSIEGGGHETVTQTTAPEVHIK